MKARHTSSTLSRWTLEMAHLGCWKSFPTDMLEIRRDRGNRHFQMMLLAHITTAHILNHSEPVLKKGKMRPRLAPAEGC